MSAPKWILDVPKRTFSQVYYYENSFTHDIMWLLYNEYLTLFQHLKMDLLCKEAYARRPADLRGLPARFLLGSDDFECGEETCFEEERYKCRDYYYDIKTCEDVHLGIALYKMCKMVGWNFYAGMPGKNGEYQPLAVRQHQGDARRVNPRDNMNLDERRALNFIELIAQVNYPTFMDADFLYDSYTMDQGMFVDFYLEAVRRYLGVDAIFDYNNFDFLKRITSPESDSECSSKEEDDDDDNKEEYFPSSGRTHHYYCVRRHRNYFSDVALFPHEIFIDIEGESTTAIRDHTMLEHLIASSTIRNIPSEFDHVQHIHTVNLGFRNLKIPKHYFLFYTLLYQRGDLINTNGVDDSHFKLQYTGNYRRDRYIITSDLDCYSLKDFIDALGCFRHVNHVFPTHTLSKVLNGRRVDVQLTIDWIDSAIKFYALSTDKLQKLLLHQALDKDVLMRYTPANCRWHIVDTSCLEDAADFIYVNQFQQRSDGDSLDVDGFKKVEAKLDWLVNHTILKSHELGRFIRTFYRLWKEEIIDDNDGVDESTISLISSLSAWLRRSLPVYYRDVVYQMVTEVDADIGRSLVTEEEEGGERPLKRARYE